MRNSRVIKKTLTALLVAGLFCGAQEAFAFSGMISMIMPPAAAVLTTSIATPIVGSLGTTTTALSSVISNAANGMMAAIVAAQNQSAQLVASQLRNQGAVDNAYQTQRNFQTAPDACVNISRAAYSQGVRQYAAYQKNVSAYRGSVAAKNQPAPADQARGVQSTDYSLYCDPNTDPDQCASKGANAATNGATTPEKMLGSDQNATTLFSGAGTGGHVENLTYTKAQQGAASTYIYNAIDAGDAPRKLTDQEYKTAQGQVYQGLTIVYEARLSMARDALTNIASTRVPIPGSSQIVAAMEQSNGGAFSNYIQNYMTTKVLPYDQDSGNSGNLSQMQLLDLDVSRRIDNPDWLSLINSTSDTNALLREQVMMTAQLMKMELMRLRDDEIMTSLAAISSAEATKADMAPKFASVMPGVTQGVAQGGL